MMPSTSRDRRFRRDTILRRTRAGLLVGGLLLAGFLLPAVLSLAQDAEPTAGYDLSWWTVDGGGDTPSEGGGYLLAASIGQPDAASSFGGRYVLHGGFWGGTGGIPYRVYLPVVLKGG